MLRFRQYCHLVEAELQKDQSKYARHLIHSRKPACGPDLQGARDDFQTVKVSGLRKLRIIAQLKSLAHTSVPKQCVLLLFKNIATENAYLSRNSR